MDFSKPIKISRRNVLKVGALGAAAVAVGTVPSKLTKSNVAEAAKEVKGQMGFLYDQGKCVDCHECSAACLTTNNWEEGTEWRRVLSSETKSEFYLSISCNHCDDPACMTVCPVSAYSKREKDGIVIQDPTVCIGCKYCMYACPYHAPQFSDKTGRISKCHFCYERQDEGLEPACVEICPTGALDYGLIAELRAEHSNGVAHLDGLPETKITNPNWVIIPKE